MAVKTLATKQRAPQAAPPAKSGNARSVQRRVLPGLQVIPSSVQRKEQPGSWVHRQTQKPVNSRPLVQPKVTIHPADDHFEKEADKMADKVVSSDRSSSPVRVSRVSSGAQRKIASGGEKTAIQLKNSNTYTSSDSLQTSGNSPPGSGSNTAHPLHSVLSNQSTRGSPLPASTRSHMESRMGADFSNVRIHTGQESHDANASIGARAFTHGAHIHFANSQFDPNTRSGQHLIAHELTHTIQQGASPSSASSAAIPASGIQRSAKNNSFSQLIGDSVPDRGPPVQTQPAGGVVQCSRVDVALAHIGDLLDDLPPLTQGLDAAKRWLRGKLRRFASYIPGYPALCVVIEYDPLADAHVERNGRNFINAALDLIPFGDLLKRKLEELNAIEPAAAWIDTQLERLGGIVGGIRDEFTRAWNRLSVTSVITGPLDTIRDFGNIFDRGIDNLVSFAGQAASELLAIVKRFLLTQIVTFIKNHTNCYELLKVILGQDPITEERVAKNGTNILNALLEMGGEQGREQRRQMQDTGTFQKAADWIDRGILVFGNLFQTIRNNFGLIWNVVSIQSLMHPIDTFNRIYETFAEPVRQVLRFVEDALRAILAFIKEVLLQRLSAWARTIRGYHLVTVLINKDPFTNEVVARTIPNIIRGFMSLMEGGEEQYRQMEESGAIARTTAQINAAVARLNMTPAAVLQLFTDLWNSFSFNDLAHPMEAFQRIMARFGEPIARLIAFIIEIVKIVIRVILEIMNFPFDIINNIITRAMAAFERIKRDPVGFLKNLLRAIKQGFIQFFGNIGTHLLNGVVGWLMSELRDANVPVPTDFTLRGVISWIMQVLGISMEAIWQKLAAHPRIGPERVARIRSMIDRLEGIWTFIRDVQQRGMAAIWDKIQEQLSNLWNTVLDAVKNWIMERIVNQVTARLLSMLDPTGIMAVINSAIAIYRAVQSFIRYLRQMLEVVNSFVNGVADIAEGNVTTAANYLEGTMGRAMPIVIGFLANQIGLSGIGRRIGEMVTAARQMVDRALTWLVNRAVNTGFAIFDRLMSMGRSAVGAVRGFFGRLLGIRQPFTMGAESHTLYFRQAGETVELMMASEPQAVRTFLTAQEGVHANNDTQLRTVRSAQRQLRAVETAYQNIVRQQRGGDNRDASPSAYNDLNTAIGVLIQYLSQLGGRLAPTGKNNNALDAIEMRWMKTGYPGSVELPVTGQRVFMNQPELVDIPDITRLQNLRNEGFSDRTIRIGISSSSTFWPAVGKVWQRVQSGVVRTGTVQAQFRRLLRELGYVGFAPGASMEADHLRDLQWGGQDAYSNLWPLDRAHNIAGNNILNQPVTYQDDAGVMQTGVPLHTTPLNRYFRITAIQPKTKNNSYTDHYEREADHIADKVISNEKITSPFAVSKISGGIQRKPSSPVEKNKAPAVISTQTTGGSALASDVRNRMESRIGADFSKVKIHTDNESHKAAVSIGARAFTHGQNIHFAKGEFSPSTKAGQHLLAHELVHTMQQGASPAKRTASSTKGTSKATQARHEQKKAGVTSAAKTKKAHSTDTTHGDESAGKAGDAKGAKKRSPSKPEEDPAFQKTIAVAKSRTRQQRSHAPALEKAGDAQNAAKAVPGEAESKAQNRKTDSMHDASKEDKPFNAASFKAELLKRIEEITPKTLEEADEFKENNRIQEVKGAMGEKVAAEKQQTVGPVSVATAAPLQVNNNENKQPVALPPTSEGTRPASIGAANAIPKQKTNDEISMQQQSASLDEEMKANNITENQLQGSNEPSFQTALKEKKNAQKDAVEKPLLYKKEEGAELKAAKAEAIGNAAHSLHSMYNVRGKNFQAVITQQHDSGKKDEDQRSKVAKDINDKYAATEKKVNELLTQAETLSGEIFDKGAETARQIFEDYVDAKMRAYKADRYSGWLGGGRWLKDKFFDLPDEVNVFYSDGKDRYLAKMDEVLTKVANTVAEKLNNAKTEITNGKKEIDDYVSKLPDALKDVGKEAADNIQDKFDSLEQSVNDKGQQLVDNLARKYVDNVKKLDERIHELKEANKGLINKAIGLLKQVWKVIKNLYELFRTILSKLAQIIGVIIGAPGKFFSNLGAAFSKGFEMFKSRLPEHLENGLMVWLSTQLGVANLKLPDKFDFASIFAMVLQVMGIGYGHIRERAVMHIGEERVALMETTTGVFQRIYREGLGAVWEIIKEKFTDFKEMIWEAIKTYIRDAVIKAAMVFLLSLLNPVAAFVKACMAIYDFLMMLVRMKDRIIDLLNSILDAVITIASGSVDAAAAAIEKAFAKSIPIIIGFLAALLHINDIGTRVRGIIMRIRARIDKLMDWLVEKSYKLVSPAVEAAMRVKNKGKELIHKGKEKVISVVAGSPHERLNNALLDGQAAVNRFAGRRVGRMVLIPLLGAIRLRYGLQSLDVVQNGNVWAVRGVLNPTGQVDTQAQVDGAATATTANEQATLEALVPNRAAPSYSLDSLNRANAPAGYVQGVKPADSRSRITGVAAMGYLPNDERGHLIADRFYGPGTANNLVPMHALLNNGTFKSFETNVANNYLSLKNANKGVLLYMRVTPTFPGNDASNPVHFRPTHVSSECKIVKLKENVTPPEIEEQTFSSGALSNPLPVSQPFNINTADETTLMDVFGAELGRLILFVRKGGPFGGMQDLSYRVGLASFETHVAGNNDALISKVHLIRFRDPAV